VIATASESDFITRRLDLWAERGQRRVEARKKAGPIRELHLELTHRCDQRCVMCHHWGIPARSPASVKREMTLADIRRVVSGSGLLGELEVVVLTGGEPWLRPDLADIAGFLSDSFPRARVGVLTNLSDPRRVRAGLLRLRARGVRGLWLGTSLDGLAGTHDRVRGRQGAFGALLAGVAMVRGEFPDVPVSCNFTITPLNYRELWDAHLLAQELGVWFGAQLVVNHRGLDGPEPFRWTKPQLDAVRASIDRIVLDLCRREGAMRRLLDGRQADSAGLWARLYYWRLLHRYSLRPRRFVADCLAGERYAMLDPEGNLFFCPVNKHRKAGDVRERGLDAVWKGAEAESERRFIRSGRCHCCLLCIMNPILEPLFKEGAAP